MKRREFIGLVWCAAGSWPLLAKAQQSEGVRRVGVLMGTSETDREQNALVDAFVHTLAMSGWIDGQTIKVERRWANGDPEAMKMAATDLIALSPTVIFGQGTPAILALKERTAIIPLVFANVTDPVGSKMVASLASPGGNMTGFTNYEQSMAGKWVELLTEAAPSLQRLLVILNPDSAATVLLQEGIKSAAAKKNVDVLSAEARKAPDIESAIAKFVDKPQGGLIIMPDFLPLANRDLIANLEIRHRLPSIHPFRVFVTAGGLMSYGVNNTDMFRRAAQYVDRILRGAKAAELPVQAPTTFELVVNLKTAKAIGVELTPTLLARADEVVE
jgi:putative ABC transport system substrate-binding protein